MFSLIQTRKNANCRPQIFIVPTSWISDGDKVRYPENYFVTLSQDAKSEPKQHWCEKPCKILLHRNSYHQAEEATPCGK